MNLFGEAIDSQAETVILHETDPVHDDASRDEKREPAKVVVVSATPEQHAQKKHGRSGGKGDTPKSGQFGTFTAGLGVCAVLDVDPPAINDDALLGCQKRRFA